MSKQNLIRMGAIVVIVTGSALAASCSGSREDVRVSFCKQLVLTQVGSPGSVRWTSVATQPKGHSGLSVVLGFEGGDSGGASRARQAICRYRYNAVDDTALTLADPLSAYSTSPESMSIDGEPLSRSALGTAVKNAMVMQGKAAVDRAQKGIEDAADKVMERFESGDGR
jgi:hypothetical protein